MEQLIFIGIIVAFSVLDAIAKKKRAQGEAPLAKDADWAWEPPGDDLATYDHDASYDDAVPQATVDDDGIPGEPLPQYTQPYGSGSPTPSGGSEGLIPRDVWEEIAALASGRPVPAKETAPVPYEAPPLPDARRPERGPVRPDHAVHASHGRYGTPVSQRLTALDRPEDHEDRGPSREIRDVRTLLSGGGASLRKAVILQELLGPPVSLRDD